jgi:uncharacterized protein
VTLFDPQLHALALRPSDLGDLRFFGVAGALAPADDAVSPATREALHRQYEAIAGPTVRRLRRAGLAGYAAVGLHPRRIPWRGLEALLHELPDFLGRRGVAALGEIGLEEGGPREEGVFARQLELAHALRRPVLVTTPWRAKERITRRALAMLREQELEPGRVLVARADARTVRMIRACGYLVGLSLSATRGPGGAIDEAVRLVRALGTDGLVLASDAGDGAGDLLGLPRAAARLGQAGLSAAVVRRACGGNAVAWLGLDPAALGDAAAAG